VWTPRTPAISVWVLGAQIIFAEADGVARAGCATCTVALGELPGGVAGFEPPQLVMLSMQTDPTNTKNALR